MTTEVSFLDHLVAWSTVATSLFTLGLLLVAIWAGWVATKTLDASRDASHAALEANLQAKKDSIEQTRPYVYVEIIPSLTGTGCYDLRIINTGRSTARKLTLDCTEWPLESDEIVKSIQELFKSPRDLPPRTNIRCIWRLTGDFSDGTSEAGMGEQGTIQVRYTSDDSSNPQYEDKFSFNVKASGLWPTPAEGPVPNRSNPSAINFYRLGQQIARHIGEISR